MCITARLYISVCRNFTHINTGVGNIHSPEFASRDYPNNMDCMWQITTPPNTRINLKVISMSIQSCDDCKCDFLEIRDGNSSSDRLLAKFCGSKLPGDLYSSGRHLWVRFKSDGEHVESGFAAMFKSSVIKGRLWIMLITILGLFLDISTTEIAQPASRT